MNLVAFYDITGWVEEERTVGAVYLDFSKAFVTVRHKILLEKLLKYGLDEQAVRLIENWLNGQAQRVVVFPQQRSSLAVYRICD